MREPADLNRIRRFMGALGEVARADARVYFTGGATAVLHGWRPSTIDIERGHAQDLDDVREFLQRGLVDRAELARYFEAVAGQLFRYPAVDPASFRARVENIVAHVDG